VCNELADHLCDIAPKQPEMGTVQNKGTVVPVLGTLKSTSVPVLRTFFKKYRGTGTVLCKICCNSLYQYCFWMTQHKSSGVTIGYPMPPGKKYFCVPTIKNCRVWSEK